MIAKETVDRIIDVSEIVDVVQDFVTLKKRGVNYLGLCPFHNEKTPSFTVSPSKGIYKCFGCGKGGNSVTFIMEHEHLSYYESLKYLAKKYNIEVIEKELTADEIEKKNERESLLIVTSFAQKQFVKYLKETDEGKSIGLSYFVERGVAEEMIDKFELGYSPRERDKLTVDAINNGYKSEFLIKTGLTIDGQGGKFDRFSERVIFPIHNLMGKVIGFGGRTLKADKKTAKYLNSPESDIYHKSRVLYGLFFAKNSIVKNDKCFLVEGYTDVISFHQSKIENVVASSGTALTQDQIRLIKRFTSNITVIYDGDEAGIKASLRGIDLILEEGMNVKVVPLPKDEDPDSFSKKHEPAELNEYINKNEKDFIVFKTELLLEEAQNDPVKKANLVSEIVRTIAVIPDKIIQSIYVKECSLRLDIKEQAIYSQLNKIRFKKRADLKRRESNQADIPTEQTTAAIPAFVEEVYSEAEEREIIRLLMNYGHLTLFVEHTDDYQEINISVAEHTIAEVLNDDLEFKNLVYKQIFEDYHQNLLKGTTLDAKHFIYHSDEKICQLAADLLSQSHKISKIWEKHGSFVETEEMKLKEIIPKAILEFKSKIVQKAIQEIQDNIQKLQKDNKPEEITEYQKRMTALFELRKVLSDNLGHRAII
jgi:DNA primase